MTAFLCSNANTIHLQVVLISAMNLLALFKGKVGVGIGGGGSVKSLTSIHKAGCSPPDPLPDKFPYQKLNQRVKRISDNQRRR